MGFRATRAKDVPSSPAASHTTADGRDAAREHDGGHNDKHCGNTCFCGLALRPDHGGNGHAQSPTRCAEQLAAVKRSFDPAGIPGIYPIGPAALSQDIRSPGAWRKKQPRGNTLMLSCV